MTVEQLYQWAKEHDALDLDIEVFDSTGCHTDYIDPEIVEHHYRIDDDGYKTVQL